MNVVEFLSLIVDIFWVLVLFGTAIFVHEAGHYLAARWFGMVIDTFSIGFGPALWKKKVGNTTYKIAIIPIGGYVALPQMDPTDNEGRKRNKDNNSEHIRELPPVSPFKKIIVAIAGAAGNIALAFLLAFGVFIIGKPSAPAEHSNVVGFVATNSAAYTNGVRTGNFIISVNGVKVRSWIDIFQENAKHEKITLEIKREDGSTFTTAEIPTEKNAFGIRMLQGVYEPSLCRVMLVEPSSSADKAGIKAGDFIVGFNGEKVLSIEHLTSLISTNAGIESEIVVKRGKERIALKVTPLFDQTLNRARIGVMFDSRALDADEIIHPSPIQQIREHATGIIKIVRSLFTPSQAKSTSEALGGPFMIFYMLLDVVRKGLAIALWFACFLNVNLAILNLLPLPVLDGGHVVMSLIEAVIRRPLNSKFVSYLYQFFFILLLGLIALISIRDLKRLHLMNRFASSAGTNENTNSSSSMWLNTNGISTNALYEEKNVEVAVSNGLNNVEVLEQEE